MNYLPLGQVDLLPTREWSQREFRSASLITALGLPLLDLLASRPDERVLDIGCGDGSLTARIGSCGSTVIGIDVNPAVVEAARAQGLEVRVMSGEAMIFDKEFDAVFSNSSLNWMRRPDLAIDGVWRALKPGGRFVGEMDAYGNADAVVKSILAALKRRNVDGRYANPWYLPTVEDYRARLEKRGFKVTSIDLFRRAMVLPCDLGEWLDAFASAFRNILPEADRAGLFPEVVSELRPTLCNDKGEWSIDYMRLRFAAVKP